MNISVLGIDTVFRLGINRWRWWLATCLALVAACTPLSLKPPIGEEIPPEPLLLALEAYRGQNRYFLRYRRGNDIFYAAGDLKHRAPGVSPAAGAEFDAPQLVSMDYPASESWKRMTRDMARIPVLGVKEWASFRDKVFSEFLPREKNTGVSVSFDRADYFFFLDRKGRFRARRLIDKPPYYSVTRQVELMQYFEQWRPVLQSVLQEHGIHSQEVLFNTGDLDNGAIPFLYINTHSKLVVIVRYDEASEAVRGKVPGSHLLMSLWHFLGSHTYAIPMRPFTSIQSLFALAFDTAMESGRKLFTGIPPGEPGPVNSGGTGMDLAQWEDDLDKRLGRPASRGSIKLLVDGEAFFTRFIDAVTSARTSVDLRAYIFDNDDVALTIAEMLKRRANEGIDVRVLFDGLGTAFAGGGRSENLPADHHAPMSMHSWLEKDSRVQVRKVKNFWLTGDHVKTMVIDRRVAFLGGMNIGREYRYDWHDLMVEITGPVVDEIDDEFRAAWASAGAFGDIGMLLSLGDSATNQAVTGYPLRLIYTKPGRQEIFNLQKAAIRRSRRYIYIENAYFTEDVLLKELILARRRGVDVRVILPLYTDSGAITRNVALTANTMLENGIRVFIYPGFTHTKAAVFDGWATLGSANMDRLSLRINREVNIATSETETVQALLGELFRPDFERSTELTDPLPHRWTDHLIEMFGDYVF